MVLQEASPPPNTVTQEEKQTVSALIASIKQCSRTAQLEAGRAIHLNVVNAGFHTNKYVATALINMYSKCGSTEHAKSVFDRTTDRDAALWNSLLHGYVENGESMMAMELFSSMDCEPSCITFVAIFKALVSGERFCLEKGMFLHRQARERGFDSNKFVASTLVEMYSKHGSMRLARAAFENAVVRDVLLWNNLLFGYVENGESLVCIELFLSMDCEPDSVSFVAVLKALGQSLESGMAVHRQVKQYGYINNIYVGNTLIEMYRKCRSMRDAQAVFDCMVARDIVSWNTLILGYMESGEAKLALEVFYNMDCKPDSVTFLAVLKACADKQIDRENRMLLHVFLVKECVYDTDVLLTSVLVDMYSKTRSMNHAQYIFDCMPERDAVSWTSLILGYVENGEASLSLDLFNNMDSEPNSVTFVAALKASGCETGLVHGKRVHARILRLGLEDEQVLANSLLDCYGKCGSLVACQQVFNSMYSHNTVSWNSLLTGYSTMGKTYRVFTVVNEMQEAGFEMNSITFTSLLTACSHAGRVEEGKKYFESMYGRGVTPSTEHYACVVDMLGRANKMQDALSIIKNMPVQADGVVWGALLGACTNMDNVELGRLALKQILNQSNE